jgi:hypothetical protein
MMKRYGPVGRKSNKVLHKISSEIHVLNMTLQRKIEIFTMIWQRNTSFYSLWSATQEVFTGKFITWKALIEKQ